MMVPKPEFALVIAYVDAGSGMLMLQMLGGAALGAWFYFRRSATKFVNRLRGRSEPVKAEVEVDTGSTTAGARLAASGDGDA